MIKKRIAILGASRGLGKVLAEKISEYSSQLLLVSRKLDLLKELQTKIQLVDVKSSILALDFCRSEDQKRIIEELQLFEPEILIYSAGGGVFGLYENKEFKDHLWTFELNFLFPSLLLHHVLQKKFPSLEQILFVGSSVAENAPDPQAASYAAAKHALRGLITSIQQEKRTLTTKVHLYSPGYMSTDLLPKNAWPRQQGLAKNPALVADDIMKVLFTT